MTDLPPLLLARDRVLHGLTPNDLAKRVKAGSLVRVRHGVYTDGKVWKGLKPWEQYRLRVQAAAETFEKPTVFARRSAASVWGIPTIGLNHPVQAITMRTHCPGPGGVHAFHRGCRAPGLCASTRPDPAAACRDES